MKSKLLTAMMSGWIAMGLSAEAGQSHHPISDARYVADLSAPRTPWEKKYFPNLKRAYLAVSGKIKGRAAFETAYVVHLQSSRVDCRIADCESASVFVGGGSIHLGVFLDRNQDGTKDAIRLFEVGKVNADSTIDFMRDVSVKSALIKQRCNKEEKKRGCDEWNSIQVVAELHAPSALIVFD